MTKSMYFKPSEDVEQWKIKYRLLLDHAAGLRHHMKEIYSATCFSLDKAPTGMIEGCVKIVRSTANIALIESVSVSNIEYAMNLEDMKVEELAAQEEK